MARQLTEPNNYIFRTLQTEVEVETSTTMQLLRQTSSHYHQSGGSFFFACLDGSSFWCEALKATTCFVVVIDIFALALSGDRVFVFIMKQRHRSPWDDEWVDIPLPRMTSSLSVGLFFSDHNI